MGRGRKTDGVLGHANPEKPSIYLGTYRELGRWTEAEKLQVQVMETRNTVLGLEHPDTLKIMSSLASTYWKQGQWTEAQKLFAQVIETSKAAPGYSGLSILTP